MSDAIDKAFADLIPGTTKARSEKAMKKAPDPEPPDDDPFDDDDSWDHSPVSKTVGNVKREFFTISALAKAWDNREVVSIHKLERIGALPKAKYRTATPLGKSRGNRLYTREQIEAVVRIAKQCGVFERTNRKRIADTKFTSLLTAVWGD